MHCHILDHEDLGMMEVVEVAGERQPRYPGRGAASGLDRGLRGQPPTWPSPGRQT